MSKAFSIHQIQKEKDSPDVAWTFWQKTCFRFSFIFLGLVSLVAYNIFITILNLPWSVSIKVLGIFSRPMAWLDKHVYHVGYDPKNYETFFGDSPFGWDFLFTIFFIAIIATFIWGRLDRKRKDYNKLHYWFRVYLSFYLFQAIIIYAVEKVIPVQMAHPNVDKLIQRVGDQSGFWMVWNFMGISPAYSVFTGVSELAAALLLLSYRTRVFGSLLMTAVLANVVCLNLFYNIPVKLLCMSLMANTLFLVAAFVPRLVRFFFYQQPVSLAEKRYVFSTPWKKWTMRFLLLVPVWLGFLIIKKSVDRNKINTANRKNEKLYEVRTFIKGMDTLPPLLSDTLYWKRFVLTADNWNNKQAVIYNMKDAGDYYSYDIDSAKGTITLHDNPDTATWHIFHFGFPAPGKYSLTGKWKGFPVQVYMTSVNIDSAFYLTQEKINWY